MTGKDRPDVQEQPGSEPLMKTSSTRTSEFTPPREKPRIGTSGDKSSVRQLSDWSSPRRRRRIDGSYYTYRVTNFDIDPSLNKD